MVEIQISKTEIKILQGPGELKENLPIQLDLTLILKNPIYEDLSFELLNLFRACIEYKYSNINATITSIIYLDYPDKKLSEKVFYLVKLLNKEKLDIQDPIIAEYSAICLNIAILPFFIEFSGIEDLKRGESADYKIIAQNGKITLESKGTNSNCENSIKEAKKQIKKSFKKINEIKFGVGGVVCFKKNLQILDKIINSKNITVRSKEDKNLNQTDYYLNVKRPLN